MCIKSILSRCPYLRGSAFRGSTVCNRYITPRRAVSDLQAPSTRVRSARVGGACKSDTAGVGVL